MTGASATSVLVEVDGRLLAIAAGHVHRILEPPAVAAVPFAPASVEGLVAVDGAVIPLIDLGAWLANRAADPAAHRGGGQVMVLDTAGGRLAVRVTRVVALVAADGFGDPAAPSFEGRVVAHLAPETIGLGAPAAMAESAAVSGAVGETVAPSQPPDPRTDPFVVVGIGGERYALPALAVREIVPVGEISTMPAGPPALLGVSYLRGVPLAVLSLSVLLGGSTTAGGVLVVLVRGGARCALLADVVLGLRRFRPDRAGSEGYLDDDGRVVTPLDPDRLIPEAIRLRFEAAAVAAAPAQAQAMRQVVTFRAAGVACALPIDEVERAVEYRAPARVPRTGAGFAEAIEVGGAVVPVVDVRRQIGPKRSAEPPGACLVTRVGTHAYALAIDRLERLATVPVQEIEAITGDEGPVTGVGRIDGQPFWLLSAKRLVAATTPA